MRCGAPARRTTLPCGPEVCCGVRAGPVTLSAVGAGADGGGGRGGDGGGGGPIAAGAAVALVSLFSGRERRRRSRGNWERRRLYACECGVRADESLQRARVRVERGGAREVSDLRVRRHQ